MTEVLVVEPNSNLGSGDILILGRVTLRLGILLPERQQLEVPTTSFSPSWGGILPLLHTLW